MKIPHPKSTAGEGGQLPTPQWVSQVGLEWLHRIVVRWLTAQQHSGNR
ncbi:hypothetical protein [Leptolyngbya sp. FACHB-711]|nr:hypothetical protein [Leptolyngbya sp. FACHB-711]MBD1853224.1 hypothetical protein [Cyanobacteria bacterium FACHB-502]MBD2028099.1 hypothetical protein [Leptolyngbya sp. FACHB-711]